MALQQFGTTPGAAFGEREAQAMTVVYRQFADTLLHVARRLTGNGEDAEDVVQEVFVDLPRALQRYRPGHLAGWLRCVTARAALMHLRRRSRRREESFEGITDPGWDVAGPQASDGHDDAAALRRAVDTLREPLRQVVLLRVYADLPHHEIAALLGITASASEVRLCRAIKQLRAQLAGVPGGTELRRTGT
jgi:RNA polymerase sigma-70 factor (ECF subfamily)